MKTYPWLLTLVVLFFACNKPDADAGPNPGPDPDPVVEKKVQLALFSKTQRLSLRLNGKNVTVNWGDGSQNAYPSLDSSSTLIHDYTSTTNDTVVITGTDISYLLCPNNKITGLDLSGNPGLAYLNCATNNLDSLSTFANGALKYVDCRSNNFSAAGLNYLFTTLRANASATDTILYFNNPGTPTATATIATGKGWSTDRLVINKTANVSFAATFAETTIALTGTNVIIDWGDGTSNTYGSMVASSPITHQYNQAAKHYVRVGGDVITHLDCSNTGITDLDVTGVRGLLYLSCHTNDLKKLDVTKNAELQYLDCGDALLTALDISRNYELTYLDCATSNIDMLNHLGSLDCASNLKLTHLLCDGADIAVLNVSKNTALTYLDCRNNYFLETLNVSKNPQLDTLFCDNTKIAEIDVRANPKLKTLVCSYSRITDLNVSNNAALINLECDGNMLTSLDISSCVNLQQLRCNDNYTIAVLELSHNTELISLNCSGNQLTSLDVSKSPSIASIWVSGNQLDGAALNVLFHSLPARPLTDLGSVWYTQNPGTFDCDNQIASDKGWVPGYF